ncbi:MAG: 50S ribosomal protein L30e [Candidatus Bathyarchaeota archaeon]|nr:MAG: 50S ribosomal protein L30e [Candidatus Bathyarchaeota archaeon]
MIDVDKAIATVVKTGKVVFGANEALRSARNGKARLILVASNRPTKIQSLEYYGQLSRVPIVTYKGNNSDLGIACGKRFAIAALTVKEAGDSDILRLAENPPAEAVGDETEE